jgi:DNA-binding transcriptional LysR family regulator
MRPALDLDLIKTFLTVVDAKGFKSAAEQLNKTPAAISQQIKRLEEILGKRVLERSNQGISLTSAGEVLRAKGLRLMALNYELLGELRQDDLAGPLKFGAPTDYAPTLLQKLLPIFQREFPRVSPSIVLEPSRALRPKVASGVLDMAIVAREPNTNEGHDLWSEEIAWFGSSKSEAGTTRCGVLTTDCVLRDGALQELRQGRHAHELVLEAASVASLRDAVEAGFCQAFLPTSLAEGFPRAQAHEPNSTLQLTFCLIAGQRFDDGTAARVARKFRKAM